MDWDCCCGIFSSVAVGVGEGVWASVCTAKNVATINSSTHKIINLRRPNLRRLSA